MMKTQIKKSLLVSSLPLLALGAMMIPGSACGDDNPLCCSTDNFQIGAELDGSIGGDIKAQMAVQAVADFAGIASVMIEDITTACRNIAQDLDASGPDMAAAEGKSNKNDRAKAWCELAIAQIGVVKANGSIKVEFDPPVCEVSASAAMSCSANCNIDAECGASAEPPTCEGGKLEVSCSGGCKGEAGASIACEGKCDAACEGSCEVTTGSVACEGKCEGTCKANAAGDTDSGIQADGTCKGECEGKCEVVAPGATCSGSCKGGCKGECKAEANVSVKCDGTCDADFEPLSCKGGTLKASCEVDVDCQAGCDASLSAKAECKPPSLKITITGDVKVAMVAKLKATLQANFGAIAVASVKLKTMGEIGGDLTGKIEGLAGIKVACIPVVFGAIKGAVADVGASATLTVNLVSAVN